jgi:hypothetical protein
MPQDPNILADEVRERLAVVQGACQTITSAAGAFHDPDAVFRQLAHIRTQIDLCRQAMIKSGLVRL